MNNLAVPGVLASVLVAWSANAAKPTASDTAGFLAALSKADRGSVITLAPGHYRDVVIKKFVGQVTVRSFDPQRPAIFDSFDIRDSTGLTFEDLELDGSSFPIPAAGPMSAYPFRFSEMSNLVLRRLNVHGSPQGTLATDPSGPVILGGHDVLVEDSDFHNLHNGLGQFNIINLTVRRNQFHNLRDDGLRGGGSSNVLVEDNFCHDNHPDVDDPDHPDCIQFWTGRTTEAAHDIVIRDNRYERGSGQPVQGIFFSDELKIYHYQRLTISGNVMIGALWNAIMIGGATDPIIEGNVVCALGSQQSWLVVRGTDGAKISHNITPRIALVGAPNVKEDHNTISDHCPAWALARRGPP